MILLLYYDTSLPDFISHINSKVNKTYIPSKSQHLIKSWTKKNTKFMVLLVFLTYCKVILFVGISFHDFHVNWSTSLKPHLYQNSFANVILEIKNP